MFGSAVNLGLEATRNRQRHVLFVAAAATDGTGVFATVTGVEGNRHQTIDHRLA
jgi:hypothetical protein